GDGRAVVRNAVRNAPAVATGDIAGLAQGREAVRGAAVAALGVGQVRVGPADGLVAFHAQLAALRGHAGQHAEGAVRVGPGPDHGAARAGLLAVVVVVGLQRVGQVGARHVERAHVAHVDHAGGAAFRQLGGRRLVDRQRVEELGREDVEVDLAVLVGRIQADRGGRHRGAVDGGLGEAVGQAADGDVQAFAVDVAVELDARHARQRLGDVGVRELADVLGEDRVGEAGGVTLGFGRVLQALPETADGHRIEL